MKASNVTVDQHGQLVGGGIHDAVVRSFRFEIDDCFEIRLQTASGVNKRITLRNIARLGLKDLVDGTIISDIFCWEIDDSPMTQVFACGGWRVLLGGNYLESDFQKVISNLKKKYVSNFFVFFESSYGGSIAAICTEIDFGDAPSTKG